MQTERVFSFFFERGVQLALMRGTAEARAILGGNSFLLGTRPRFTSAPQIDDLGHWPLPQPIPRRTGIYVTFASTAVTLVTIFFFASDNSFDFARRYYDGAQPLALRHALCSAKSGNAIH